MTISSPAFENHASIPGKYTCDGENVNPGLQIRDVPSSARSLTLIMEDPDAPAGTWVHWMVYNIDPKTTLIAEGGTPTGAMEGLTSFDKVGYGGPCPPSGTHRYFFKVYALDTIFHFAEAPDKAALEEAMKGHILDQAELIGLYTRG